MEICSDLFFYHDFTETSKSQLGIPKHFLPSEIPTSFIPTEAFASRLRLYRRAGFHSHYEDKGIVRIVYWTGTIG